MTNKHLADLKFDPNNARKHTPRNIHMIEDSLQTVGAGRSILIDEDDVILAGNGVVEAAANAGIERVRVIEADGDEIIAVRRSNLTPEQKTKMALFDNRTAELATWNADVLTSLKGQVDMDDMWFDDEFNRMIEQARTGERDLETGDTDDTHTDAGDDSGEDITQGDLLELVDITIAEPRHQVHKGERWRVGRHLLVCASVATDHALWRDDLGHGTLFCPYPGPFTPLTLKADDVRMVMVQPNTYIAGHILDRYEDVHGEAEVSRA